jgi:hypothetical protein
VGGFSDTLLSLIAGPRQAPVAQINPLDQQEKQQAIAESSQAQQLNAQKIEQQKMMLDDQKTLRSLQPQFVQKNESGKPTGYDWNGLISAAQGKVMPATLFSLQKQQSDLRQSVATAAKDEFDNHRKVNSLAHQTVAPLREIAEGDPQKFDLGRLNQTWQSVAPKLQSLGFDPKDLPAQFQSQEDAVQRLGNFDAGLGMHLEAIADAKTQSETNASNAKAANENAQAGLNQIKLNLAKDSKPGDFDAQIDSIFPANAGPTSGPNRMYKSLVNSALKRGDLDSAKQYIDQASQSQAAIYKEIATANNPQIQAGKAATAAAEARATQPYKIEQAAAEGKARQLIQGMAEPVYAYVQQAGGQPQKTLMSKTDALQAGIKTMLPVTEKEVGEDTMLINRLSDVHQKISRYENAMQKWDMSYNDRLAVQSLVASDKFKLGAFGAEIPVDSFNKIADQLHVKNLSGPARDALVAYYNAHEAMVGYNRVLSGSGKSSDKALQLQGDTLPDIATADHDMAARAFRDFKENLNVVGQGLPSIPGVKSPEEWDASPASQSAQPGSGPLSSLINGPSNRRQKRRSAREFPEPSSSALSALIGE